MTARFLFGPITVLYALGLATSCALAPRTDSPRIRVELQDSPTDASLRGVCAVDARVAWASGASATVLRTVDGGATWTRVPVDGPATLDYRDIHALDAERAWILSAGSPAVIRFTSDGGRSWTEQYRSEVEGVFFDAMDFWDARHGMAFSDPVDGRFLVVVTDDAGTSWREVPRAALPPPLEGEAGFAGSGTCLRVSGEASVWIGTGGGAARILRSDDRGATWSVAASGFAHGPSAGVFSLAFADELRGVAVGGDYRDTSGRERVAATTVDGGQTWRPVEQAPPSGFRSAVERLELAGETVFLAAGPSGMDVSLDLGRTWQRVSGEGFHAVSSADGACWAVGADGRIARLEVDR